MVVDAVTGVLNGDETALEIRERLPSVHVASVSGCRFSPVRAAWVVAASPLVKKWAERSLRDSIGLFLGFLAREPFARMMSAVTAWLPDLRRRLDQVRRMMTTSVAHMALTLMCAMSYLYWVMVMAGLSARPSPFYLLRTQRE